MPTLPLLLENLVRVYGHGAEVEVAKRLMEFLSLHTTTTHITIHLVRQLTPGASSGKMDGSIVKALQFLAGDSVRLLDTKFEVIDSQDQPHDLTDEEAQAAISHQIDPVTGELDPGIGERLTVYFSPTPEAFGVLRDFPTLNARGAP